MLQGIISSYATKMNPLIGEAADNAAEGGQETFLIKTGGEGPELSVPGANA